MNGNEVLGLVSTYSSKLILQALGSSFRSGGRAGHQAHPLLGLRPGRLLDPCDLPQELQRAYC